MAGFMDSVNKGLTTINVKTSNFMEESKFKTAIATKEAEIVNLYKVIGEAVYNNREAFDFEIVAAQVAEVEEKFASIAELKGQIESLAAKEKEILGGAQASPAAAVVDNADRCFCGNCGAPNSKNNRFCEKCGSPIQN